MAANAEVPQIMKQGRITPWIYVLPALLILMVALKLLEMKSQRDVILCIYLGFFLVWTNFLFSQTIPMGAYMLACVWLFVGTLVGFHRGVGRTPTVRERLVPSDDLGPGVKEAGIEGYLKKVLADPRMRAIKSMTQRGGRLFGVIADVCAFANTNGGTLYLDGRACELCVEVTDAGKHATLAGLAEGRIDIVIGTHKLLGREVRDVLARDGPRHLGGDGEVSQPDLAEIAVGLGEQLLEGLGHAHGAPAGVRCRDAVADEVAVLLNV